MQDMPGSPLELRLFASKSVLIIMALVQSRLVHLARACLPPAGAAVDLAASSSLASASAFFLAAATLSAALPPFLPAILGAPKPEPTPVSESVSSWSYSY